MLLGTGDRDRLGRPRTVTFGDHRLGYDQLIIATGARHSYFGHDEWEQFAPGLKTIDDATAMRRRILLAFERAEDTENPPSATGC